MTLYVVLEGVGMLKMRAQEIKIIPAPAGSHAQYLRWIIRIMAA